MSQQIFIIFQFQKQETASRVSVSMAVLLKAQGRSVLPASFMLLQLVDTLFQHLPVPSRDHLLGFCVCILFFFP